MENYRGRQIAWVNRLVQTRKVEFGRVRYLPGGSCGPRRQRDYQLVVIQVGDAKVLLDRQPMDLPVDNAVLFLPGHAEHFLFSASRETEHIWCSIRPSFMPADLRRRLDQASKRIECSSMIQRLFSAALAYREVREWTGGQVIEHLALSLFAEYLRETEVRADRPSRDDAVGRATAWIEEHYWEEDCLARAREAARCSRSGLNQKFREHLGSSPARHLWLVRLERGVAMLRSTGLTAAEISTQCGFKNPFHFSRMVSQRIGMSPREVRRHAWK